ncbi:MAG: Microtubule-nucleating Tub4p (gamma-tubulin) complex component [Cyphobasidiales sp. Tagirdzhanova-0007]|nr:MAG: Microtubule-nucleating Tub4p (gamma-tubulin) complex component [Cyphobasidiales sp. Tagirdzhanova-0007]
MLAVNGRPAGGGAGGYSAAENANENAAMSMKAKLAAWRSKSSTTAVPEDELLRDAVLILQGIDGKHLRFHDSTPQLNPRRHGLPIHPLERDQVDSSTAEGGLIFLAGPSEASAGSLLRACAMQLTDYELGWLYRKIQRSVQVRFADPTSGMIELSLSHCLQEDLRKYDNLIAELETRRTAPQAQSHTSQDTMLDLTSKTLGLTLARLIVWTEDFKLCMRMMGVLVEACTATRGGALLSFIHSYTAHGDPFIRSFTSSLLEKVSGPFFKSLAAWIYEGELVDPSAEFFVERNGNIGSGDNATERENGAGYGRKVETWSGRYRFRREMLPSFVGEHFGSKIFSTGRSLNYIKYACNDSAWVTSQHRQSNASRKLQYSDIVGVEQSIDLAYSNASKRLFGIFFDKFGLLQHLRALKDYLLLGRGDFVELLMESLGPSLSKPANTLYRHNLTATLETAIRGSSSATDHPDVLRRLDARMLEFSHGEIGWDVFTLEYKVDPPVDVVLDSSSMGIYTRMFTHLWRIKRTEYALNEAWKRVTNGSRWFTKVTELQPDFHQIRIALSEMIHFVRQLQYFCHLEVIDCSWAVLEEFAQKKEGDLDALIEAHQVYVDRLAGKALLRGRGAKQDDTILEQVREAFKVILQFKETIDAFCNYALAEASRKDSAQDEARASQPFIRIVPRL